MALSPSLSLCLGSCRRSGEVLVSSQPLTCYAVTGCWPRATLMHHRGCGGWPAELHEPLPSQNPLPAHTASDCYINRACITKPSCTAAHFALYTRSDPRRALPPRAAQCRPQVCTQQLRHPARPHRRHLVHHRQYRCLAMLAACAAHRGWGSPLRKCAN